VGGAETGVVASLNAHTLDALDSAIPLTIRGELASDGLRGPLHNSGGVDGLFSLVKDQPSTLALGTFIELSLSLGTQDNVIVMPFNALYGLNRVYRLNDGYLEAVKISRVGEYEDSDGQTQLLIRGDNLNEGDRIVSTQLPNAITGLRVEAMNDDT
jgi:hypothetical protein